MSVDWHALGQKGFDRTVEGLFHRRFEADGEVIAYDGRGGDAGKDIEVVSNDGKRRIYQLKYFPEGFSSGWARSRRPQIKKSYATALQHNPDEWILVVPNVLTTSERNFVQKLNAEGCVPLVSIIGRDTLDSWLADDPRYDEHLQRDGNSTLERMAKVYNYERAALLAGIPDVAMRLRDFGSVVDSVDPDWTLDFGRFSGREVIALRPQHPQAAARSPITFSITTRPLGDERADLRAHIERGLGYATADPIIIPGNAVESVTFGGPAFIAGDYPPGDVRIGPFTNNLAVGKPAEIKLWSEDTFVASFRGKVVHAARGQVGGSVQIAFYDEKLKVQFRLPHSEDLSTLPSSEALRPGVDLAFGFGDDPPDFVEKILSTARCIRLGSRLELSIDNEPAVVLGAPPQMTAENYDQDLITIEQYAYDLHVVQQHCNQFFNMPQHIEPGGRVAMRVARLLIEGHIVAWPHAQIFTVQLNVAEDTDLITELPKPIRVAWRAGDPYTVKVGDKVLTIGDVYAVHHAAVPNNADEAIAALKAGEGDGFQVHYRPGNDSCFYLTLADVEPEEVFKRSIAEWSLIGVDQPGLPDA